MWLLASRFSFDLQLYLVSHDCQKFYVLPPQPNIIVARTITIKNCLNSSINPKISTSVGTIEGSLYLLVVLALLELSSSSASVLPSFTTLLVPILIVNHSTKKQQRDKKVQGIKVFIMQKEF